MAPLNHIPTTRRDPREQLRAVLYARTSRDPRKRATSTKDQMEVNARECDYYGWTVVAELIDDDRSASISAKKSRDGFQEMIRMVQARECDVIVATELSRLTRDLGTYYHLRQLCQELGVIWCLAGSIYDLSRRSDLRATAMDAVSAEDESRGIKDRVLRTVRLNAERGRPHGRVLFGYKRIYNADTGELEEQVAHPTWGPVVQEIFRRLAAGDAAYGIAKDLERRGLKPPERFRWDGARMIEIASNPSYLGKRVFQGAVIGEAAWDPLVDDQTWRAVQRILRNPARRTMPDTMVRHLLTGIAVCGVCECHCPMRMVPNRGRPSYSCKDCFCVSILKERLDAYVEEHVITWLGRPEAREMLQPEPKENEAYEAALAELEDLEGQLAEARSKATDPNPRERLSVASLMAVEAGLQPLIDAKKAEVQRLLPPMPLPELEELAGASDVDERWNALKLEKRRAVLRAVASVEVFKGRKGSNAMFPGRVVVTLGPQQRKLHPQARLR